MDTTTAAAALITDSQRHFLATQRVARFASADAQGQPHVVPVCYCVIENSIYFSIDEKPKQANARGLKRLRNIEQNPKVSLVVDRYDENWSRLAWVMLRGKAEILAEGDEHAAAQRALRSRYVQYRTMRIDALPVVAIRIEHVAAWGALQ